MNLLALDTSTEACSAALLRADGAVFSEFEIAARQHTRLLPQMISAVLHEASLERRQISHCAFANGPGAFTGIRIAAAQAQGIAIGLGIPLLPVSTLAILAQVGIDRLGCKRPLVALDARMGEIYWAVYRADNDLAMVQGEERLNAIDAVEIDQACDCGLGHGWLQPLRESCAFAVHAELLPDAKSLLRLAAPMAARGLGVSAGAAGINYLRNRVAEKPSR